MKRRDYELEIRIAILVGKMVGIVAMFGALLYWIYRSSITCQP